MIEWILKIDPKLVAFYQVVSSTAVAVAGFCVALAALIFGYRNNFGWKPVVLVRQRKVFDHSERGGKVTITVKFEIWNRRKYPIAINGVNVAFRNERSYECSGPWMGYDGGGKFWRDGDVAVEEAEHQRYEIEVTYTGLSGEDYRDYYIIQVHYFDPRSNRSKRVYSSGEIDMRALYKPITIPAGQQ